MKICARCHTTKESDQFDKHRAVCKTCRNLYHKNRREDLKDGKRDALSWYEGHREMTNERTIEILSEKLNRGKGVLQVKEIELRCSEDFNHNWFCLRWFLYTIIIIFGVLNYNFGWI
jgi:hypothetical protein